MFTATQQETTPFKLQNPAVSLFLLPQYLKEQFTRNCKCRLFQLISFKGKIKSSSSVAWLKHGFLQTALSKMFTSVCCFPTKAKSSSFQMSSIQQLGQVCKVLGGPGKSRGEHRVSGEILDDAQRLRSHCNCETRRINHEKCWQVW